MTNHYEASEVIEIGRAQDVILGNKTGSAEEPVTGDFVYNIALDETDE